MNLLLLAIAPIFIILVYIYYRDKYEREPLGLLFQGLLAGGVIVLPILFVDEVLKQFAPQPGTLVSAAFNAFLMAAVVEEGFKLLAVYILIWKNPNFNERFDGIVYAVFVSLGFALVENVMYVMGEGGGASVGYLRAITAVPAHAIFGIVMGFRIGLARFVPSKRAKYLFLAFILPVLLHGLYNFLIMSQKTVLLLMFVPLLIAMYWNGRRLMKKALATTPFNPISYSGITDLNPDNSEEE